VFQDALDQGFLGAPSGDRYPFALMWANRMPRRVLPVRRVDVPVIEADRLVPSDVDDFVAFVRYVAERYFVRPNYLRVDGRAYFSIFDATYFMKELGVDGARAGDRRGPGDAGVGRPAADVPDGDRAQRRRDRSGRGDRLRRGHQLRAPAGVEGRVPPGLRRVRRAAGGAVARDRRGRRPAVPPGGDPGLGRVAARRRLRAEPAPTSTRGRRW
jgi:hypothetical protein